MASAFIRERNPCLWSAYSGAAIFSLLLGVTPACGESASNADESSAGSGTAAGTGGGSAGTAGPTAGNAGNSSSQGGSASSGGSNAASGSSSGGKPSNGGQASGGTANSAGNDSGGADNEGGTTGDLVDCDPMKITCKRAAPPCASGEVPRVDEAGNCYGACVKIDRCACSTAQQCPDNNQYTCWAKQHCGPYVQ